MGREASFQAIPEDCELLLKAREDAELATVLQFIQSYGEIFLEGKLHLLREFQNPSRERELFYRHLRELIATKSDVLQRHYYAGARTFDAIIYLLSPLRRSKEARENRNAGYLVHDGTPIADAFYGTERLHPDAYAGQGQPIGFVPAKHVPVIADYLESVTREQLHEHYVPAEIEAVGVYKMYEITEERFEAIWEEFVGMHDVYRAAADHGEAMITVID